MIDRARAVMACVLLLAACGGPAAKKDAAAGDGELYVKAHDIKQLMAQVVEVNAQKFWHSAGWVTDDKGEHDLSPTTDEGWQATRSAAATVTEMGNLLMTPLYAEGRGKDWLQFSRALVQMGQEAEKAAAKRDTAAIFDSGAALYRVCQSCHQVYIPKVPAPANGAAPNAAQANAAEKPE